MLGPWSITPRAHFRRSQHLRCSQIGIRTSPIQRLSIQRFLAVLQGTGSMPLRPAFAGRDGNAFPNQCVFANGTDLGLTHICGPRCFVELMQHSRFPRFSAVFGFHPCPKDQGEQFRRSLTVGSNFETSSAEAGETALRTTIAHRLSLGRQEVGNRRVLVRTRCRFGLPLSVDGLIGEQLDNGSQSPGGYQA